ncbi:MAG: metallophosphatase family protein, partial [Muribaculaceae bacterium]|nr:metallophosphatase family protein [Muribaculaceae bacterium]
YWDTKYLEYFADCDEVWHAGDVGDYGIIEQLSDGGRIVRSVYGNTDYGEVRRKCKEIEIFEVEGFWILLVHIGGYPGHWAQGIRTLINEQGVDMVVDGHSHILKIVRDPATGVLVLNPGAAGKQGWHKKRTLIRLTIDTGKVKDCEVIELGS